MGSPKFLGWLGGVLGVVMFGSFQAAIILVTAELFTNSELKPLSLILAFCILNAGRFPLFAGAVSQGREVTSDLREMRREYVEAVLEGAKVERFPRDPFRALAAMGLVLSKGAVRAWLILMFVAFVQVTVFSEPAPDVRLIWVLLSFIEAAFITMRSMRNGTLALVGLSVEEMRELMESTRGSRKAHWED